MIRAQVMTTWTKVLAPWERYRPQIDIDFTLDNCTDQPTNQPGDNIIPDPNIVIVEITCTPAVYDAIYDHPDYGPGAIQWSVEI